MAASVTSLDADMKRLRMSRYTPKAAKEVRTWIEDTLGEVLPNGDLLEVLKDGTILCRLANLGLSPPIKFKKSPMPFIQMENISHFLTACEAPPFNLPSHDRFLTVDLYEAKDPAQVLQCIGAFSRVANSLFPNRFRSVIGPKRVGQMSPSHTGASNGSAAGSDYSNSNSRARGMSNATPSSPPGKAARPASTAFGGASSILYSGYMHGASQGNQGISFGARRQITTPAPYVPSLAEKERRRREKDAEDERARQLAEEARAQREMELKEEEARAAREEEERWEAETRRAREEEKRRVEAQKKEWEAQERRWREDEEKRRHDEEERERDNAQQQQQQRRARGLSDPRLRGQLLSEYKAEQQRAARSRQTSYGSETKQREAERARILELERQLEEAKERERLYEEERTRRDDRAPGVGRGARSRSRSRPRPTAPAAREQQQRDADVRPPSPQDSTVSWTADEREVLRRQHSELRNNTSSAISTPAKQPYVEEEDEPLSSPPPMLSSPLALPSPRPLPDPMTASSPALGSARPLPQPGALSSSTSARPLPDPAAYASGRRAADPFSVPSAAHAPPPPSVARTHQAPEFALSSAGERRAEEARRRGDAATRQQQQQQQQQQQHQHQHQQRHQPPPPRSTGSGSGRSGGAWSGGSKSALLEREMERERERQREWEAAQRETRAAAADPQAGSSAGQSWDVNQYGYVGGDSQNRGATGIGFGQARRQIIGPRPPP